MESHIQEKYFTMAHDAGAEVAHIPEVGFTTLMGSVALGMADEHSDIDMLAVYDEEPSIESIHAVLNNDRMNTRMEKFWLDGDKFSISFKFDGVSAAVVFMKRSWYEGLAKRYPDITMEEYKQFAHCIGEAIFLNGDKDLYDSLKSQVPQLPKELREKALTHKVASLRNFFIQESILPSVSRKDWLFVQHLFDNGIEWALEAVYILNNKVYASPKFARSKLDTMEVAPKNMVERLEKVASGEATEESVTERMKIMAVLSQEISDLADTHA